jgi:putative redox protein
MSQPHRTYSNAEVTVEWRPDLCVHCRKCVEGLPAVFNLDARPWVNINGATADEIRKQVGECPSNALALGATK